jgi:putative transposase
MDQDRKKQVAIFRFGVISDFFVRDQMERGERERLLADKCAQRWQIPFSNRTRLSRSTILGWVRLYRQGGQKLESLYPQGRNDRGRPRALDEDTAQALIRLKREMPKASVSTVIAEMRRRRLASPDVELKGPTVYRFLRQLGLMGNKAAPSIDRRKFEAELPNDIWQSDAMHGPMVQVGDKRRKSYLFAFIDDMSRLVPHAEFFLSEGLTTYLDALRQALLKRGLPRKLYLDNGAAFRSRHLEEITASLGIALVHSPPYQPQGRGKIERFFRTVRSQFLPAFKGQTLPEINEALERWLSDEYHQRKHHGTGQPPLKRFAERMECVRPAPPDLEDYFRKRAKRRVALDRTVSLAGRLYEAPVPLIGKQVVVLYHDQGLDRVEVMLDNRSHGFLIPLDLAVNCRVRRQKHLLTLDTDAKPPAGGALFSKPKDQEEPA